MIRGTTPTYTFYIPKQTCDCKRVAIYFSQHKKCLLRKCETDCKMEGNTVSVTLTQDETLKFNDAECVEIQAQVLLPDGTSLVSDIYKVKCGRFLGTEVLE